MQFGKLAIIGPGLLGGSMALALRERGLAREFALYGRRPESLAGAEAHGMREYCSTDLAAVCAGAEFCVLATPVGAMAPLLEAALPHLAPHAVITDVGSVKGQLVYDLEAICLKHNAATGRNAQFVGSHPMAGSEQTGFQAARADLFVGATCFVTPTGQTQAAAHEMVRLFWRELGASVAAVSPDEHDPIVARISHVPHLMASLLVNLTTEAEMEHCGGGFRDTTRIASGSPAMWTEILLENGAAVESTLTDLMRSLDKARQLIAAGDSAGLHEVLERAKASRDKLPPRRAE